MRFKQFISEGKYLMWVRLTVGTLVLKINNLTKQIENKEDPIKQNKLISQQNKLLSYISGLAIGGRDRRQSSSSTTQIFQIQGVTKTLLK